MKIYQETEPIKRDDKLNITGGLTIHFEHSDELFLVAAIYNVATQPPFDPLDGLYNTLSSPAFDQNKWETWKKLSSDNPKPRDFFEDRQSFTALLADIATGWNIQKEKGVEIDVFLTITTPKTKVSIESAQPGLVIYQGSINFSLLPIGKKIILPLTKFFFSLIPRKPQSAVQQDFYIELRSNALKTIPDCIPLQDIAETTSEALKGKALIIVFLHGLLSIDIGTFDELIREIQAKNKTDSIAYFGYPHDTLCRINSNAQDLSTLLFELLKPIPNPPQIILIGHSRGGLVARATAVEFYKYGKRYEDLLKYAITFGTPHEGSPLAEQSRELKGVFVASQFFFEVGWMAGFKQMVDLLGHDLEYPGIYDLRVRHADGNESFIYTLRQNEKRENMTRLLAIHAIGGKAFLGNESRFKSTFVNYLLNGENHDMVVPLDSSIKQLYGFESTQQWACDHFSYFKKIDPNTVRFITDIIKEEITRWSKRLADNATRNQEAIQPPENLKLRTPLKRR